MTVALSGVMVMVVFALLMRRGVPFALTVGATLVSLPRIMFVAFVVSCILTALLAVCVRLVLPPLVRIWYAPHRLVADVQGLAGFRLESGEFEEAEVVARRMTGWHWTPGVLVKTNRAVWFFPAAADAEPWRLPLQKLAQIQILDHPGIAFGAIQGFPPGLAFHARGEEHLRPEAISKPRREAASNFWRRRLPPADNPDVLSFPTEAANAFSGDWTTDDEPTAPCFSVLYPRAVLHWFPDTPVVGRETSRGVDPVPL